MYQIIFAGLALTPFTQADLDQLLMRSRAKNHLLKISGLMLYKDSCFVQVLEGPDKLVQDLWSTIEMDFRLQSTACLSSKAIVEREFGERPMGFVNIPALNKEQRPDLAEFLAEFLAEVMTPEALAKKPGRARELLEIFRKHAAG